MISCTEFIPAYNELFRFLDELGGTPGPAPGPALVRFWASRSDAFLDHLRNLAIEKGLAGCYEYWSHTLVEEAADFRMTLDEEQGLFEIEMRHCPSKGRLLAYEHVEPYAHYCQHCDALYRRVLEPLGYAYEVDLSRSDHAACLLRIRRKAAEEQAEQKTLSPV